jgi:hypothetical protein
MSAGSAKTEKFNLGAATVMIGPKDQVLDLVPEKHSIGLVKNFTFSSNDQYIDLTQGVRNTVVYSVKTGSEVTASMEAYEYTAKNLAYALGLEGYELSDGVDLSLKEAVDGDMVTTEISAKAGDASASDILAGDYVIVQGNKSSNEDMIFVGKVDSVEYTAGSAAQISVNGTVGDLMNALKAANGGNAILTIEKGYMKVLAGSSQTITLSDKFKSVFGITESGTGPLTGTVSCSWKDSLKNIGGSGAGFAANDEVVISIDGDEVAEVVLKTNPVADTSAFFSIKFDRAIPEGFSFVAGDRVHKANLIPVGSAEAQPTLGAKIVGILPEGKAPITIIIPKLRITNGFSLGFQTDQYGNMPFEFTPFEQIPSDPLYKEYGDKGFAFLLD